MFSPLVLFATLTIQVGAVPAPASNDVPLLIRNVTVNSSQVVFSLAGDLWRLERAGGAAERLTEGPAEDDFPVFSPDGGSIAFSRRTADDWDVYVIDAAGGEPRRLTYHPEMDIARGWSPDGLNVLFMSHRDEEAVFRLYSVAVDGVFPRALPLPRAWSGSYSPDGQQIAYVPTALPLDLMGVDWHYYRGGMVSRIWIAELASGQVQELPHQDSNDRNPMWVDSTVYFVSDRSGTFNLYGYDLGTHLVEQLTQYETYGIESASAGGGAIAFVRDGRLYLYDRRSGDIQTVSLQVDPDRSELAPRTVSGARWIQSASLTGSGDLLAFTVRGDVVTFDPATDTSVNLTRTSGAADRYAAISPDGQSIAYITDETGDYELRVRPAAGDGPVQAFQIETRPSFYRELTWSPDSKYLAFTDKRLALWALDVETGGARRITTSSYSYQDRYYPTWSPDGAFLAYSKYESNRLRAVYLYEVASGRQTEVSGGRVHAEHPAFDRSGRYLFFVASNTAPLDEFGWSVLSGELFRPLIARRLQMVLLRGDEQIPFFAATGERNPNASSGGPPPAQPSGRQQRGARPGPQGRPGSPTMINTQGIQRRIVPLPAPVKDYAALAAGPAGELYVLVRDWSEPQELGTEAPLTLYRYELSNPRQLTKLVENVREFIVSHNGRTILYRGDDGWALVPGGEPPAPGAGRLDLASIEIDVDPAAEWQQIYHESWQLMNDYFYDPNLHGQNLLELQQHYAAYLPSITRRSDLNRLLGKALGHISVSHLAVRGGDIPQPAGERSRTGLIGADYTIEEGRYKMTRIFPSGHYNWGNPLFRSPLDEPGFYVQDGEYLIAIDGEEITADRNIYSYFAGTSLKPVELRVGRSLDGSDARSITVVPTPGENTLRRVNWAERNRQIVEEESQGVLGYVWVPGYGSRDIELVLQQLLESSDKSGLVIDQRFAGGGITSDYLIEMLRRTPLYYYTFRHGDDIGVPVNSMPRAKVLLINDVNASAAETFALMFRLGNVGRVIGTRTMGAGIGPYVYIPELIDGGRISIPNRAAYDPAGSWGIENMGVEPHLEVDWYPADWLEGRDPQLQAAINAALQAVVDNPPYEVIKPDYPVYGQQGDESRNN
jgi:tricorn protease